MVDRVCVMKHGEIVEENTSKKLFAKPQHAYTKMLLAAQPKGQAVKANKKAEAILEVKDIKVYFSTKKNFFGKVTENLKAVDDVSATVHRGQTLGIVGESGSGKTTLALAMMKLLPAQGTIIFQGNDISNYSRKQMQPLREDMQIVFQDPFGSLSPRMSVAEIIGEGLKVHRKNLSAKDRDDIVVEALKEVHIAPETRHRYPHEFSGGQRQRISVARALALKPDVIVMDEPTSALDMSVQAEVVDLLRELQTNHALAYMFISHDLRVVRAVSHYILVMKNGVIVEEGETAQIFDKPKQDYTKKLMRAALDLKVS